MYSTPLTAVAFFISFEKKLGKSLALSQKLHTFANAITKVMHFGSLAQLNRASDYGSEGWGFESLRAHHLNPQVKRYKHRIAWGFLRVLVD